MLACTDCAFLQMCVMHLPITCGYYIILHACSCLSSTTSSHAPQRFNSTACCLLHTAVEARENNPRRQSHTRRVNGVAMGGYSTKRLLAIMLHSHIEKAVLRTCPACSL